MRVPFPSRRFSAQADVITMTGIEPAPSAFRAACFQTHLMASDARCRRRVTAVSRSATVSNSSRIWRRRCDPTSIGPHRATAKGPGRGRMHLDHTSHSTSIAGLEPTPPAISAGALSTKPNGRLCLSTACHPHGYGRSGFKRSGRTLFRVLNSASR